MGDHYRVIRANHSDDLRSDLRGELMLIEAAATTTNATRHWVLWSYKKFTGDILVSHIECYYDNLVDSVAEMEQLFGGE